MREDHEDLKDISDKRRLESARLVPRLTTPENELTVLIEAARHHQMTDSERFAQQRSWALGEYMLNHPEVSRDEAIQRVDAALAAAGVRMPQEGKTTWHGLFKLVEEIGELSQVLGKLGPFPDGNHPDGGAALQERLAEEMADVEAAILYFRERNQVPALVDRRTEKLQKFRKWSLTGVPV